MWKVPLADVRLSEDDVAAVADVLRSGWLSMGPRTEELEAAFAAYAGVPHALATANGTAALQLACTALGLGPGDEVVVPALTFVATVSAVAHTGATPVFADVVSPEEPWLDPGDVSARITPRTRAMITLAYGGHPGTTRRLAALGPPLLEDAAHAAGSRLGGRQVGTFGLAGAFSFFANKNLAVGEGGIVVTSDAALAERMRLLRSHGMTTLTWDRHRGHASTYDVVERGFNFRMDEPRAALALRRLAVLDEDNRHRARHAAACRAELPPHVLATAPSPGSAHHLLTVVLDPDLDRDAVRAGMAEDGIQTSVHYPPAHRLTAYADAGVSLPRTEDYAARTITLPLFAHMTEAQRELVVASLRRRTARGARRRPGSRARTR